MKGASKLTLSRRILCAFGLALVMAGPALSQPPAPGKADTNELDTYLRRNEFPLTVKLIAVGGQAGTNVPVTMGIACGEGDYPVGKLCPVLNGKPIPAQVDVRATWPKDGSIRHALLSLIVPRIDAGETLELTFPRGGAVRARPADRFKLAVPVGELVVEAKFVNPDGTETISQVPAGVLAKIAGVLADGADAGDLAPRMAGPICYEFEIHDVPRTTGAEDPDIDVFYRLRVYSGVDAVRIACVVENTRLPAKPYPQRFTIRDRDFTNVVLRAGLTDQQTNEYRPAVKTHWYGTRYRVLGWCGPEPLKVYAKESFPYLVHSNFFPKLGLDHPVAADEEALALKKFRQGYDYDQAPLGRALDHGHVHRYMPGVAGRPDIGAYAVWHRLALASESPKLHHMALAADGNALGAFPIHRRQAGTFAPGAPHDDKINPVFFEAREHNSKKRITYVRSDNKCRHVPDFSHTPSAAYYSYLTTGDKFFEEELAFWGMYPAGHWPFKGILMGPTRATAWQLRNTTDAAFLLPDRHPRKAYLIDYVNRNLTMLQARLDKNGHLFGRQKRKCSGRKHFVCSSQPSPWMYTWLCWSLDNTARKGWPQAATLRDGAADFLLRLYEGAEEFTAPNGKVYRYNPKHAMAYSIAIDLIQVEYLDNGYEKDTSLGSITDNTGAVYYYTLVNDCHKYFFSRKSPEYAAWKAKLPKKIMRPEDWVLDESKALAGKGALSNEYGNAECSAALARYDNPLARHMYGIVRKSMGRGESVKNAGLKIRNGKLRIRGIEYVK